MLKDLKIPPNRNAQKALFNHTKESHSLHILGTFVFLCMYKRWSIWLVPSQDCTPRIPPSFSAPVMHTVLPVLPMKALVGSAALAGANAQPQKFEWLGVGGHTLGWLQKVWLKMFYEKCMRISPLTAYTFLLCQLISTYWRINLLFDAWCLAMYFHLWVTFRRHYYCRQWERTFYSRPDGLHRYSGARSEISASIWLSWYCQTWKSPMGAPSSDALSGVFGAQKGLLGWFRYQRVNAPLVKTDVLHI